MRPRSMTGFGRGEMTFGDRTWIAEVRTVNHRYLDQRITLPRAFGALEDRVRKIIASNHARGRVDVTLQPAGNTGTVPLLSLNTDLARQYHSCLMKLRSELNIASQIELDHMLTFGDIIDREEQNPDFDREWKVLCGALDIAINECCLMREQEGKALKEELLDRLEDFSGCLDRLAARLPEIVKARQKELWERFDNLLAGLDIDPVRLTQEAAIMADKADVTEELVRLRSHISQFAAFLDSTEPIGRRLDFLLQEFLREVNTIASKVSSAETAHLAVELKNEIEKMREQVQNIE
ncbi:MAG: YicC/YloC family endoribonuclease [Desulfobulbaceae bacterium]|nr:YicC/YloC family endoribonuclease [Desulfobulbaceae bacterium]